MADMKVDTIGNIAVVATSLTEEPSTSISQGSQGLGIHPSTVCVF